MLGQAEFDFLRGLVRERSALVLEPGKEYLVDSRLMPLLREGGYPSAVELCAALRAAPRGELERVVVEAMTTNETSFFRDMHPFDLAILLAEHFPQLSDRDVSILATDISRDMVQRTGQGMYGELEMNRGLPAELLVKYFQRSGPHWQANPGLRRLVQAREMNRITPWPSLPRFDVIMLRNVLIYFDLETKRGILRRARQVLRPDGFLFLGGAETAMMVDESWEWLSCDPSVAYRPVAGVAGMAARHAGVPA